LFNNCFTFHEIDNQRQLFFHENLLLLISVFFLQKSMILVYSHILNNCQFIMFYYNGSSRFRTCQKMVYSLRIICQIIIYNFFLLDLRFESLLYNRRYICTSYVEINTKTTNITILCTLYAIHQNVNSMFCILINLDIICSPNNLFMTDIIVSSLLRWLYKILLYPCFISFVHLPRVFHTGTCSYLGGMILNPSRCSLTSTWLSSLSCFIYNNYR